MAELFFLWKRLDELLCNKCSCAQHLPALSGITASERESVTWHFVAMICSSCWQYNKWMMRVRVGAWDEKVSPADMHPAQRIAHTGFYIRWMLTEGPLYCFLQSQLDVGCRSWMKPGVCETRAFLLCHMPCAQLGEVTFTMTCTWCAQLLVL